jgi:hypothetical protein
MSIVDLPNVKPINQTRPLARKVHLCSVCGQPIAIGQSYERHLVRNIDALDPKKSLIVFKWHAEACPEVAQ